MIAFKITIFNIKFMKHLLLLNFIFFVEMANDYCYEYIVSLVSNVNNSMLVGNSRSRGVLAIPSQINLM